MSVATPTLARASTNGEQYRHRLQKKVHDISRVPAPIYRHAAPSAPWPWMNFDIDPSEVESAPQSNGSAWEQYPQNLFRNWTSEQVNRSEMLIKCGSFQVSTVYKFDVPDNGVFNKRFETFTMHTEDSVNLWAYWHYLGNPPSSNIRVQVLFVKDMSSPVLQILGTRFNIEPFFFASSVKWIPSRYREDPQPLEDHITIILPFIRILKCQTQRPITRTGPIRTSTSETVDSQASDVKLPYMAEKHTIDTQAALSLPENKIIHQDLLSLHMVRRATTSTIISYHPSSQGTSAKRLQSLVQRTGDSVYWSNIFKKSKDPTFLLLAILWYALYAWDEAFEALYHYINALEHKALQSNDMGLTQELHKLQAHLLQYQQLLQEFLRSVEFIRDLPSPAMNADGISLAEREGSQILLRAEADNLKSEVERLDQQREMLFNRLKNVIQLIIATVNIDDSKAMQELAETSVKDSTGMKLISYLAMFFLPAQLISNIFSMNVIEINPQSHTKQTLAYYVASTVGLTLFTSWLAVAARKGSSLHRRNSTVSQRILWPLFCLYDVVSKFKMPTSRRPPPVIRPSGEGHS